MDRRIWENPIEEKSLDESQCPLWFWNDKLENEELLRQLKMQSDVGVRCTNPHARTNMGDGYIGGYLDDDWFEKIGTVLNYKKENQEPVWLYDEIDWPAGTCGQTLTKNEDFRERYLTIEEIRIPAGEKFRVQLKDITGKGLFSVKKDSDLSQYAFNVAVVDEETGKPYHIQDYLSDLMFGPEFEFSADRDAVAYVIRVQSDLYEYGGNLQVSYINGEATQTFLESTYEKYYERYPEYFGSTIKCVFNDETRMCHALVWSRDFVNEFEKRKGYSLAPVLYQLVRPGVEAGRVRCDYFDVVAALFQENYFKKIHDWCNEHGIGLFAHLLGEETLFGHARYSGDYLRQNRYLDCAGADHLGKGIGSLNIKFTACGAHSYGRENAAVEVFAGCGWDMTFEEYIRIITWMFQQGMKIIINHGFFYSDRGNRKNDWPPSQFFQWQGWDRMKEGNAMVRRLHYALTGGKAEADVLVYHPMESFWLHYLPDQNFTHGFFHGAFLKDEKAEKLDREVQLLLNGLSSENLDFDLIHKDAVENFKVSGKKIVNRINDQEFSILVLPMCEVLCIEAARLCREFTAAGGTVLAVGEVPSYAMPQAADEELREIFRELSDSENFIVMPVEDKDAVYAKIREIIPMPAEIVEGVKGTVNNHPVYDSFLIDPYIHTGEDLSGVLFTRYLKGDKRHTLFMNYSDKPETIVARISGTDMVPEIWDTFTGEIKEVEVVKKEEDNYFVKLTLPCNYGVILVSGNM